MFRRGGSTGGGITSGLRQGYDNGKSVNIEDIVTQQIPEPPKSSAGADFCVTMSSIFTLLPLSYPCLNPDVIPPPVLPPLLNIGLCKNLLIIKMIYTLRFLFLVFP
jgi:hypothetical protein